MQKNQLTTTKTMWLTAAIALAMLLFAYFLLGIYPFGDGTVLTGDLKGQYISYYSHFRRVFTSGAGFAYGMDKGLGGSLLGLFAYYVSSPLNLLYLFVPNGGITVMASIMLVLKLVLACVSFAFYITKKYPGLGAAGVALSLGYGFMAYTLVYAQNIMWHDVVILLPLICHGIDAIIEGKRNIFYIVALALAIFANFYIAYMACIFVVLYFLYGMLAQKRPWPAWRRAGLSFAGGSLLAGGLCGALLLPSLANINASKGAIGGFAFGFESNFSLRRLPERLVWGNFVWSDVENGLPELYFGILALLLLVCWFTHKGIPLRQKLLSGGVIAVLLLSFWVKGLDVLWHGGKAAIWFPYRNSFLLSFFCIALAGAALQKGMPSRRNLLWGAGILTAVFGCMAVFPIGVSRSKILLTLAVVLLFAALLYGVQRAGKPLVKRVLAVLLVAVTAVELGMQGFYILNQFEKYTSSEFNSFLQQAQQTVDAIKAQDAGAYRVEKTVWNSMNDAMMLNYNGITHFGSTQDVEGVQALEALGYRDNTLYATGSTAFADSLLGIRYLFADGSTAPPAHMQDVQLQTPYPVYQNPYALPLVFAVPGTPGTQTYTYNNSQTTFANQNQLYAALTGQQNNILLPVSSVQAQNAQGNATATTGAWPAGSRYTITAQQPGYYYAQLKAPQPYSVHMWVNEEYAGSYFTIDTTRTIQLGFLQAGQSATLGFNTDDELEITEAEFVYTPEPLLQQLAQQAQSNSGNFTVKDGSITGNITVQGGEMLLFTSLPYDENWTAEVNGEVVLPQRYMAHFMAIPLTVGENAVALHYKTPLVGQGFALTVVCAAAFVCLVLYPSFKDKIRRKAK